MFSTPPPPLIRFSLSASIWPIEWPLVMGHCPLYIYLFIFCPAVPFSSPVTLSLFSCHAAFLSSPPSSQPRLSILVSMSSLTSLSFQPSFLSSQSPPSLHTASLGDLNPALFWSRALGDANSLWLFVASPPPPFLSLPSSFPSAYVRAHSLCTVRKRKKTPNNRDVELENRVREEGCFHFKQTLTVKFPLPSHIWQNCIEKSKKDKRALYIMKSIWKYSFHEIYILQCNSYTFLHIRS